MFEILERSLLLKMAAAIQTGLSPYPATDVLETLLLYRLERQGYVEIVVLTAFTDLPLAIGGLLTPLGIAHLAELNEANDA
ncbi:MAG: hypothetical protein HY862_07085 [Chloroflexi bacterium]|nr:hypothetical protein [Chloroflexota bacterium]